MVVEVVVEASVSLRLTVVRVSLRVVVVVTLVDVEVYPHSGQPEHNCVAAY